MKKYTISQLAKITGITSRSLRYYDQIGLLKPSRINDANYRVYDENDLNKLQQILIYKQMELSLDEIKNLTNQQTNRIVVLRNQKKQLLNRIERLNEIINTIDLTILNIKGEYDMKDDEKFAGLKDRLIKENDDLYKEEVISKYGAKRYEQSKQAFKNFTAEQYEKFVGLNDSLIDLLVQLSNDLNNQELRVKVAKTHQEWLTMAWGGNYDTESHYNLVEMYLADPRFTAYYDKHKEGLTEILVDCVKEYLINMS